MITSIIVCLLVYTYIIVPGAQWLVSVEMRKTRRLFGIDIRVASSVMGVILLLPALGFSIIYGKIERRLRKLCR